MTEGLHVSSASFTPHGSRSVHAMHRRWRGCSRVLFSLIFSSVIYMSQLRHVFNHLFLLVYWPPLHAEHLPPPSYHQQFHLVCQVPSCDVERFPVISTKITFIYSHSCITFLRHQQSFSSSVVMFQLFGETFNLMVSVQNSEMKVVTLLYMQVEIWNPSHIQREGNHCVPDVQ